MSDETPPVSPEVEAVGAAATTRPTAVGPGPDPVAVGSVPAPRDSGDVALLRLIDRLSGLLDRSDLTELEVTSGETGIILRTPAALAGTGGGAVLAAASTTVAIPPPGGSPDAAGGAGAGPGQAAAAPERPSVRAPLTGIFYASPAPGSAPYVAVGREVAVGQVIGLIEAMKLFNEIKSDLAGRVVRVVPESGTLVKAKQPLIEVEPL